MLIYKPEAGTYLPREVKRACDLATCNNEQVRFTFNQTTVEISPCAVVDQVVQAWLDLYEKNRTLFYKTKVVMNHITG